MYLQLATRSALHSFNVLIFFFELYDPWDKNSTPVDPCIWITFIMRPTQKSSVNSNLVVEPSYPSFYLLPFQQGANSNCSVAGVHAEMITHHHLLSLLGDPHTRLENFVQNTKPLERTTEPFTARGLTRSQSVIYLKRYSLFKLFLKPKWIGYSCKHGFARSSRRACDLD